MCIRDRVNFINLCRALPGGNPLLCKFKGFFINQRFVSVGEEIPFLDVYKRQDFCRRRQADQTYMDKLFIPVQGCLLEVVREQYTDFYRDKERWRYLQKLDTKNSLLSLDGFTDSEGNPLDFIADEAMDVAEIVVNAVMVDRLKAALPLLSDSEQELIQAIFFDGLSEREVGARLGITQSVVNKRKAKILIKLRKIIEN